MSQGSKYSDALVERPESRSQFDEATIHRALTELAACSGNSRLAEKRLAADEENPLEIDHSTLWSWANKQHPQAYARIRAELLPKIQEAAADMHMDLARRQAETSAEALEHIKARIPHMDDRDAINAMGKLDIGSGIHTEKAQLLAGQPTQRVEKSAGDVLRKLRARGMQIVDGKTEEVEVEEVVSSSGLSAVGSAAQPTSVDQ